MLEIREELKQDKIKKEYEKVNCPRCQSEYDLMIGRCARCPKCGEKIGECDS